MLQRVPFEAIHTDAAATLKVRQSAPDSFWRGTSVFLVGRQIADVSKKLHPVHHNHIPTRGHLFFNRGSYDL